MATIDWQDRPGLDNATAPAFTPAADVVVGEHDMVLTMDLPGLGTEDVTIDIHDGCLTVRGHRPVPAAQRGARSTYRERRFGAFERHLRLPEGVDPDAIAASMDRGVLSLLIPRRTTPSPMRIPVGPTRT